MNASKLSILHSLCIFVDKAGKGSRSTFFPISPRPGFESWISSQLLGLGCSWIGVVSPPKHWPECAPQDPPYRRVREAQCKRKHLAGKPRPLGGSFKSGSLERGESADGAEEAVLRVSAPWLITQMCRFPWSGLDDEFSLGRPPRSWA
jgi:hypothetical protein